MLKSEELNRFNRQLILPGFGLEAQQKLKEAKVLVIGAGGLGCPALLYLNAAGVGTIGIMDGDEVSLSNLHRQILYSESDIGKNKALTASEKLGLQNPHTKFDIYEHHLDADNALEIFPEYDVILDGSDNFETRYLVNDACVMLDLPFVYGAVLKFEGQVAVFNLGDGPTYRCLFPDPPNPASVPNCSEVGVIGVLPGIIGNYQANEVIKILTGIGSTLSGKLLIYDALEGNHLKVKISTVPENKLISELGQYDWYCEVHEDTQLKEITLEEIQSLQKEPEKIQLVDVRETYEFETQNIGGINLPLHSIKENLSRLDPSVSTILICQSGKRSKQASQLFLDFGFKNLFNLKGGIGAYEVSEA